MKYVEVYQYHGDNRFLKSTDTRLEIEVTNNDYIGILDNNVRIGTAIYSLTIEDINYLKINSNFIGLMNENEYLNYIAEKLREKYNVTDVVTFETDATLTDVTHLNRLGVRIKKH